MEGELPILQRRRIEAEIIRPIYDEMVAEMGVETAREVLTRAIEKAAIAAGASFAERTEGGTNMDTFRELYGLWTHDGALEIDVLQADEQTVRLQRRALQATRRCTARWASAR